MKAHFERHNNPQAGLAMVEFAIALPLLMIILIGLIETGRFMYFSVLVGNAAHAGAQYGAQSGLNTTAGMQTAAKNDGQNVSGLSASATYVCTCWNGTTANPDPPTTAACSTTVCPLSGYHAVSYAQVTATGSFTPMFHYPGLPTAYSISRTSTMRISQ